MIKKIQHSIDNFPTIKIKHTKLCKEVSKIIEKSGNEPRLEFSIFDSVDDDKNWTPEKWTVIAPDILSKKPVFEGKCIFFRKEGTYKYAGNLLTNPTWSDIIIEANRAAGIDHRFLEQIEFKKEIKKVKHFEMWFGS